jgi:hypothetical protein
MNPFMPFCLFVAARIYLQCYKMQPENDGARSALQFLLLAMAVLRSTNPMADSFLVQLELELEGTGVEMPPRYPSFDHVALPDDPKDGTPWVKIVSPLVDIVEIGAVKKSAG